MEVREIELDQIIVEERFRQDLGNIDELVASIKEKGLIQPITISTGLRLLAGGRRLEAHKRLGLKSIPAITRGTANIQDEREIELYENIHRKDLTWQERARLEKAIYDLKGRTSLQAVADETGGSKSNTRRHILLAEAMESIPELGKLKDEADAWKALNKIREGIVIGAITKRAQEQASELDEAEASADIAAFKQADTSYRLGDAFDGLDSLWSVGGTPQYFDVAEVDPPYGIDLVQVKRAQGETKSINEDQYQEVEHNDYEEFLADLAHRVHAMLKPDAFCIWWFGITHYNIVREALRRAGFSFSDVPAIWDKGNQGQTNQPNVNLANCYESFFLARKGSPVLIRPGRSNIFSFTPESAGKKIHPTERPIELIQELLRLTTVPGARVLSPFLGSGNTLRAAWSLDMVGLGWDLDKPIRNKFLLRVKEDALAEQLDESEDRGALVQD
jgi:ParB/RepB/Spo0J family partition protein